MRLSGKKIAVLAADLYQEMEIWYPVLRFREEGAETVVVGAEAGKIYSSKKGYPVVADKSISDAHATDFDALIVPGGWAPDSLRQDERMLNLVREMDKSGKILGAICHAGWVLCSADVLRGRTVTCYKAIKDDMINAGAEYLDKEVVVDGNLITSRMPTDLPAFCREIANALAAQSASRSAAAS
jgi:protease I